MNTYWGASQHVDQIIGTDVIFVSCSGHGGMGVKETYAVKHGLDKHTTNYGGFTNGYYWFEEDCDWVIPCHFSLAIRNALAKNFKKTEYEMAVLCSDMAMEHHYLKNIIKTLN